FIPSGAYFAAYDAGRHAIGAQVGTVTLDFASRDSATLSYTINGVSGTKGISRIAFGPPDSTPVGSYGDLWWGGTAQNGWGISINQQYRTLFSLWDTYDAEGGPTGFVMAAGVPLRPRGAPHVVSHARGHVHGGQHLCSDRLPRERAALAGRTLR